jgi:hypothetical protein
MLCWNVRGLGDSNKCVVVKDTIKEANASILASKRQNLAKYFSLNLIILLNIAPPRYTNYLILPANRSGGNPHCMVISLYP